jgi:chemotaxis protein histidine kinase CheA
MGGAVSIKSTVGEGSTFSIIFRVMCKLPKTFMAHSQEINNSQSQIIDSMHKALAFSLSHAQVVPVVFNNL